MLEIHNTAIKEIMDQGGNPAALARHQIEIDKLVKKNGGNNGLEIIYSPLQGVRLFVEYPLLIAWR
ncbi:unnamed protein product [Arabidopsis thaliana]|uniref:Uncharacterized protein n=1 Tax=Arabidopsis thaliana TaxID=3702 RepID=A0A654FE70_ARATH|nr:unnamed protein product [Arabidopsis thaliana]